MAAQKAIWGPTQLPDGSSAFPVYRELGVDTLQLPLVWANVAQTRPSAPTSPDDPAYQWPADLDAALDAARTNGVEIALRVDWSPGWANGNRGGEWAPNDPKDYADFLTAASRRYPSVRVWMIWGEPNLVYRFQPNLEDDPVSARTYAPLLDAAYASLKSVSAENIVVGGMTWSGGTVKPKQFLRWMRLPSGRPPRLDWYGHNPFPFRFPNLLQSAMAGGWRDISDLEVLSREVREVYASLGVRPKLWLSEFTIQSDHDSDTFPSLFVSQAEQARWLAAGYEIANSLDSVEALGWFTLFDQPESPRSTNWGLLEDTGERKPSYAAYQDAPSRRFRPTVRSPRRISRSRLATRGLFLRIRPAVSGAVVVRLATPAGRTLARRRRNLSAGHFESVRVRRRIPRRGRQLLEVFAPRGEPVRRTLFLR